MSREPIVFVVDDDTEVQRSLRWLLEAAGHAVRTFDSAEEFLEAADPDHPGCLILDVRMGGMDGLELQETLNEREVGLPVILVSAHADVPIAVRAMKSGALGVLEKPYSDKVLLRHVDEALAEDAARRGREAREAAVQERVETLTPREREVMGLVVHGSATKQIAHQLGISPRTVEIHRARVMEKMQAGSVAELVRLVMSPAQTGA
jgi:FixJ family two-component response regulator